jgi:hypothetical protein
MYNEDLGPTAYLVEFLLVREVVRTGDYNSFNEYLVEANL